MSTNHATISPVYGADAMLCVDWLVSLICCFFPLDLISSDKLSYFSYIKQLVHFNGKSLLKLSKINPLLDSFQKLNDNSCADNIGLTDQLHN